MDADSMAVVGWIVGIAVIIGFFYIGYLVSAIRKDVKKQTKLMLASSGCMVGKDGVTKEWPSGRTWGVVQVGEEEWNCISSGYIGSGVKVRVKSVDGTLLMVEMVK